MNVESVAHDLDRHGPRCQGNAARKKVFFEVGLQFCLVANDVWLKRFRGAEGKVEI